MNSSFVFISLKSFKIGDSEAVINNCLSNKPCGKNTKLAVFMSCKNLNSLLISSEWLSFRCRLFLVFFTLLLNTAFIFPQDAFRRHFLVTYDISKDFSNLERSNIRYQRALEDLFQNLRIDTQDGNSSILTSERQDGKLFFDKEKDEISFFHFNIPPSETGTLNRISVRDKNALFNTFTNSFIRRTNISWSRYKNDRSANLIGFIYNAFNTQFNTVENSAPNLVFPLVMNNLKSEKPAEEYILIILTQRTPEEYNDQDVNYIRTIFPGPLVDNENSPVVIIRNQVDYLSTLYDRKDYFNFLFRTAKNGNQVLGIFGYIITPAGIIPGSSAQMFSVKSETRLKQTGYQSQVFRLSTVKVSMPRSGYFNPAEVYLTITGQAGNNRQVVYEDAVRYLRYSGKWISGISDKLKLVGVGKSSFKIKGLEIPLKRFDSPSDYDNLIFNFKFNAQYSPPNANPVNYIFHAESVLPGQKVNMVTFWEYVVFSFLIPVSALLILILVLIYYGKPTKLEFRINGYLDSFLKVDYRKYGQIHTPYKFWNTQTDREDIIVVDGHLTYRSPGYLLNWNPVVVLNIHELASPEGFSMVLKPDGKAIQEYSAGNHMGIRQNKEHNLRFFICVRQNDITRILTEPEHFKIKIEARIRQTIFLIRSKINEKIRYKFHIGNDLGDVWVGLDPGTTGSCIAVGTQADDIVLGQDIRHGKPYTIIPSKLVFNVENDLMFSGSELSEKDYKHGVLAANAWDAAKVKFQSFKKLLGYCNKKTISFKNNKKLELTGKELSGLMVKGIFNDLASFLELTANFGFYSTVNGSRVFNPKRAVVAAPNNATLGKVQDLIDCVGLLKQFKEVRYIYEAEAVLFYYLGNYSKFNPDRKTFEKEVVLIFDMGGATINATVVSVTKTEEDESAKFNIDILGKIGYSVGGDSIDYCLVKFILSFSDEFPELKSVSIDTHKDKLLNLAREIKEIYLGRNYYYNPKESL